jgi:hypothetical protein
MNMSGAAGCATRRQAAYLRVGGLEDMAWMLPAVRTRLCSPDVATRGNKASKAPHRGLSLNGSDSHWSRPLPNNPVVAAASKGSAYGTPLTYYANDVPILRTIIPALRTLYRKSEKQR